jgi:hypothetical protein
VQWAALGKKEKSVWSEEKKKKLDAHRKTLRDWKKQIDRLRRIAAGIETEPDAEDEDADAEDADAEDADAAEGDAAEDADAGEDTDDAEMDDADDDADDEADADDGTDA